MKRWICHNCQEIFDSPEGHEFYRYLAHAVECLCIIDFFEIVNDEGERK